MPGLQTGRLVGVQVSVLLLLCCCQPSPAAEATPTDAMTSPLSTAERSQLHALEARPLAVPGMPSDGNCVGGPQSHAMPFGAKSADYLAGTGGTLYGTGPAYFLGGADTNGKHVSYYDVTIFTDPTVQGVVLVRGEQLGGRWKVVIAGPWAAGAIVGSDAINGRPVTLYSEIALPADHPRTKPSLAPGWSYWEVRLGVDSSDTHLCLGFQIDTTPTSEVFVVT
jgi:hypothetical protein